jgi:hypothetical protein
MGRETREEMSAFGLLLALLGVLAWALVLRALGRRQSTYRVAVVSVAAQTVVSTLVAVGLASLGAFRAFSTQAAAVAVPSLILAATRRSRRAETVRPTLITRSETTVLVILLAVAPVSLPRMEPLAMTGDAGVYTNRAIHHLQTRGFQGLVPARDRIGGDLRRVFDKDNLEQVFRRNHGPSGTGGWYLPGTYLKDPDRSKFCFQFLPGWPMLMAQWAGLFGLSRMYYSVFFVFSLAVLFFGFVLEDARLSLMPLASTVALFASSPLLLYFSKYTTSEMFLLFLFLLVICCLAERTGIAAVLAGAALLTMVVSHVSTFLYAPLALLPALEAFRSRDRRLALFAGSAFGLLLASIPLGMHFSPYYFRDVYALSFRALHVEDPARAGIAAVFTFYALGLAVALVALRRAGVRNAEEPQEPTRGYEGRLLSFSVRALIVAVAFATVYRGYQIGWTDSLLREAPMAGAWAARAGYAARGWSSLAHLNFVSMVMATSLVGLPVVLYLTLRRGGRACATTLPCFLLAALLLSLGIYTLVRFDTPLNYYGSRYFIPVFVPSTMLLFGLLGDRFLRARPVWILLLLAGLAFNLRFDVVLLLNPIDNGRLAFVQAVARRVGDGRVLFVLNRKRDNPLRRELLALPLYHLHEISLINVVDRPDAPARRLMERYAAQLHIRTAAVLSGRPPEDEREYQTVRLSGRRLRSGILYPRETVPERVRLYFIYEEAFP